MGRIIVFGAGGRAGRAAVREAQARGHQVTAVVRDPDRHRDLAATETVRVAAGDVTDAGRVGALAVGHDAAIHAAADLTAPPDVFFPTAARALTAGMAASGTRRLLVVGLASVLPTAGGELLMDTAGYPQEYRSFYLGHAAGVETLRHAGPALDWLVLSPAGDFDHGGTGIGRYRRATADAASRITYADFAIALLDETETPRHRQVHLGVEQG
ncbi:NAD(P)-dependent oxidoreductase [Micromonospora sp. SD12]|uniref:NAD(P)-dependent oxidoreductase n=1 Tax=Micromonospora sp. SD12 TaxID=3452216 RepID=UPI003F89A6CB